jgi:RNA polymerase sigma-70 factor (ECF subfamily)
MAEDLKIDFINAYNKYADAIYRYCYFRVYSTQLAEELMQETFMRVWKYLARGKEIQNIQALLYQIARNLIIDLGRRDRVRQGIEQVIHYGEYNSKEPSYNGRVDMERKTLLGEIYVIMKKLSHDSQDILVMRYIEGLSPREIAEIFHTSPNNISVRIYKSLKRLGKYV